MSGEDTSQMRSTVQELATELLQRVKRRNQPRSAAAASALAPRTPFYEFTAPHGTLFEHVEDKRARLTNADGNVALISILDMLMYYDRVSATPPIESGTVAKLTAADLTDPDKGAPTTHRLVRDLSSYYEQLDALLLEKNFSDFIEQEDATNVVQGPDGGIFYTPRVPPNVHPIAVLTGPDGHCIIIPFEDLLFWGRDYLATQTRV